MPEYFDLFDENNQPLNQVKERKQVHLGGDWHRTSQIWVVNEKKELLCNLRSKKKDVFAGFWDLSIGGHVVSGDTYDDTALRELEEELGLKVLPEELEFLGFEKIDGRDVEKKLFDREHAKLFLFETTMTLTDFKIQEEEIDQVAFFKIEDLIKKVETKDPSFKFIPAKPFFIKILRQLSGRFE